MSETVSERVPPMIITALLPEDVQRHFDELRRKHFPVDRNHLDAHLTLFHALPGELEQDVRAALTACTARSALPARIASVRSLGRGVAYRITSDELKAVRARLVQALDEHLTPQDRNKDEFHVTIQNKVDPAEARALLADQQEDFEPSDTVITGLGLWRYLDGPWEPLARFAFEPRAQLT